MSIPPDEKKSAVIFGATGLVGKELITLLLENKVFERIVVVVRKLLVLTNPKLKQIQLSDFSKLMDLKDRLKASVYFCSIGTTIKTAGSKDAFLKVDLDIPKKIAQPSLLMGNRDEFRFGEKVAVVFMKAFGWIFAGPLKKYKGIYVRDVARSMIKISDLAADKMIYESDELHNLLSKSHNQQ